ncbi:hypothetical protein GCM10010387_41210 [Streptomyces inusitatus]|uniref:Integral membrane protein n=1 Tax=Streptomyces inusitatus TaxID=68221 RepID=A0A918QD15_9ACTN|nr:hypothetical protein [Streptomyces inusitatus]GGZ42629.1 hypothetical protein GCM10010387_41210 [Streptomyces inusitatus]
MLLEVLGSVLLGLGLAWAAHRQFSARLPARRAVFLAGPIGALFGAWVTHLALGPGQLLGTLVGALLIGAVLLSLLLRPPARLRGALRY